MNATLPAKPFIWRTQDGERMRVDDMRTTHLFFAVRMIWNHTVPPPYRILGCKECNGPQRWSESCRRDAVVAMLAELARRDDLPVSLDIQLGIMRDRARELFQERIEP